LDGDYAAAPERRRSADTVVTAAVAVIALAIVLLFFVNTTWYQVFKAIHVLAAVVWVGGGLTLELFAINMQREGDPRVLAKVAEQAEWLGKRVYTPSSFLLLAMGFVLVHKSGAWGFGDFWVAAGLVGWALTTAVGLFFFVPKSKQIAKLLAERPADDPEVQERISVILRVARADTTLLLLIVADMVAKPFS
jgi:uncharacterized membrane protein